MNVQAVQWEVTNQQLKAIHDYAIHLQEEQDQLNHDQDEQDQQEEIGQQSELEMKVAHEELQYFKKQKE